MVGEICPEMGSALSTITIRHKRWYWKIVEKTWSKPPKTLECPENSEKDRETIEQPSIK